MDLFAGRRIFEGYWPLSTVSSANEGNGLPIMTHRIVFLDRETIAPQVVVRRPAFEHTWVEYPHTAPEQLGERLDDASIVITNKVPMREPTLVQAPSVKLIAVAATGTDVVDVDYCRAHGIAVATSAAMRSTPCPSTPLP